MNSYFVESECRTESIEADSVDYNHQNDLEFKRGDIVVAVFRSWSSYGYRGPAPEEAKSEDEANSLDARVAELRRKLLKAEIDERDANNTLEELRGEYKLARNVQEDRQKGGG